MNELAIFIYVVCASIWSIWRTIKSFTEFKVSGGRKLTCVFNYFLTISILAFTFTFFPIFFFTRKTKSIVESSLILKKMYEKKNQLISISCKDNIIKLVLTYSHEVKMWPTRFLGYKVDVYFEGDI